MFKSLGDIIADGPTGPGRTGEPVRRHSRMAGRCEGTFWRRMERKDARLIVMAARKYELAGRQPGERNGPLGGIALEVLDFLANLMNGKTGRLDPAITYLMERLKRSRDAIVRALKALRAHGFLDWLRRYTETGSEGRGPRVQQTSNAYRLSMPPRAFRLLGWAGKAAPAPDDHSHRIAAATAERAAYEATLPIIERTELNLKGECPEIDAALMRLAALVQADERESARQSESPTRFKS